MAAVHPGTILLNDVLKPMGITRYRVAKNIGVPQRRVDQICRGESSITAEMALRLAALLGTSAEFWVNLQAQYDLEQARAAAGPNIAETVVPLSFADAV